MTDLNGGPASTAEPTTPMGKEAAEVAGAVTGEGTPAAVRVVRPTSAAIYCQVGALVAACVGAACVIYILAWKKMPEPPTEAHQRVWFIGWMGLSFVACIALSALSQFFNRVSASAGPGHLDLGGRP